MVYGAQKKFAMTNRMMTRWSAFITIVLLFLPLIAGAAVPNPTITGPIPATVTPGDPSRDYPFFATDVDLAQYGYVEQEYFMQGAANQYTTPAGATGAVISTGNPYKTRLLVRRPISASTFNGTVLLEWYNVTNGFDTEADWFQTHNYLLQNGYAWIGVSAQRAGVNYLQTWSPAGRYSSLDVTVGGTITDDSLSYDIFSQAGQAILNPSGVNLLPGLTVQTVIPSGDSQSASRLVDLHQFGSSVKPDFWRIFSPLVPWERDSNRSGQCQSLQISDRDRSPRARRSGGPSTGYADLSDMGNRRDVTQRLLALSQLQRRTYARCHAPRR